MVWKIISLSSTRFSQDTSPARRSLFIRLDGVKKLARMKLNLRRKISLRSGWNSWEGRAGKGVLASENWSGYWDDNFQIAWEEILVFSFTLLISWEYQSENNVYENRIAYFILVALRNLLRVDKGRCNIFRVQYEIPSEPLLKQARPRSILGTRHRTILTR